MIHEAIAKVVLRQDLSEPEMMDVMTEIGEGRATPAQIGALLVGLRMKGECVDEVTGAARVLRSMSVTIPFDPCGDALVDTCGTGGDGAGTFNISTTTAFVVAGCGVRVAKHGNRSVSSRCGSADVLEALGLNLDLTPQDVAECLQTTGIGFLFAPSFHPAMRHAVLPRRELGVKSIFNVIGPLTNPAGANVQILGVYSPDLTETLARVLQRLGCRSAFVVHGQEGLDEISISGPTRLTRLADDRITTTLLTPEDLGLKRAPLDQVQGGDAARNAVITREVLEGRPGPARDAVLLNSAAALAAAGRADSLQAGLALAAESIDRGLALAKLESLITTARDLGRRQKAVGE
jgi:anthranilate phosphoribosyltransferase